MSEFGAKSTTLLPNNVLTISCEMDVLSNVKMTSGITKHPNVLAAAVLAALLPDGEFVFTDVILITENLERLLSSLHCRHETFFHTEHPMQA